MAEVHEMVLHKHIEEALNVLVGVAEKYNVRTMHFRKSPGMTGYSIALGENSKGVAEVPVGNEDPFSVLTAMELITILKSHEQAIGYVTGQLRVTPKAMAWVEYQRKGKAEKWLVQRRASVTRTRVFLAVAGAFIIAVATMFNEIVEALRTLKLIP